MEQSDVRLRVARNWINRVGILAGVKCGEAETDDVWETKHPKPQCYAAIGWELWRGEGGGGRQGEMQSQSLGFYVGNTWCAGCEVLTLQCPNCHCSQSSQKGEA